MSVLDASLDLSSTFTAKSDPLGVETYLSSLPVPNATVRVDLGLDGLTDDQVEQLTRFAGYTAGFVAVSLALLAWRFSMAVDLTKNNHGLFQHSSVFYREGANFFNALPYSLNNVPTFISIAGLYLGGYYTWATFIAGFVVVPFVELIVGEDSYNPTPEQEDALKKNIWFRVWTWLYVPTHLVALGLLVAHISANPGLTLFELTGLAVSFGTAGGFGIGCVHELIHRPTTFELGLGIIDLVTAWYSHFWIEHLWGHHKRVATDEDPASSGLGESLYSFMPKCLLGSFFDSVAIEKRFQNKKGRSFFTLHNRIFQGQLASAVLTYFIYTLFGATATAVFVAQGVVSFLILENVNYIEHYGLRRDKMPGLDADGEQMYERPGWFHAWNTGDRLTNWLLFKIERHPDHHTNAGRPYQILRTYKESPTYPTGYAGMVVLSWFPPLWFLVMDPLVAKAYKARREMDASGENYFPRGSNNMSSVYKREGEGFFEPGSSPYSKDFYGEDRAAPRQIYETQFEEDLQALEGKKSK